MHIERWEPKNREGSSPCSVKAEGTVKNEWHLTEENLSWEHKKTTAPWYKPINQAEKDIELSPLDTNA